MKIPKPERPSCSSLTERQWKNILEQFEYEWDLERGFYQGPEKAKRVCADHLHDVATLEVLSLICPAEREILVTYDAECYAAYVDEMERFKKALIERVEVSK